MNERPSCRGWLLCLFVVLCCTTIGVQHYQVHEETEMYRDAAYQANVERQHNKLIHEKQILAANLTREVMVLAQVVQLEAERANTNDETARHFAQKYVTEHQRANMLEYLLRMTTIRLKACEKLLNENNIPCPAEPGPCALPEIEPEPVDRQTRHTYKGYGNQIASNPIHPG